MQIEIVYTTKNEQNILELNVPANTSIRQALELSRADIQLDSSHHAVGIFGKLRSLDWVVKEGDRIEIYRPLMATPNEHRLKRAKIQKQEKAKLKNKSNNY